MLSVAHGKREYVESVIADACKKLERELNYTDAQVVDQMIDLAKLQVQEPVKQPAKAAEAEEPKHGNYETLPREATGKKKFRSKSKSGQDDFKLVLRVMQLWKKYTKM